jgi:hypothetical protein
MRSKQKRTQKREGKNVCEKEKEREHVACLGIFCIGSEFCVDKVVRCKDLWVVEMLDL